MSESQAHALSPAEFYGSRLPRPRIFADPKLNLVRVDKPQPLMGGLLDWAKSTPWSKGGLRQGNKPQSLIRKKRRSSVIGKSLTRVLKTSVKKTPPVLAKQPKPKKTDESASKVEPKTAKAIPSLQNVGPTKKPAKETDIWEWSSESDESEFEEDDDEVVETKQKTRGNLSAMPESNFLFSPSRRCIPSKSIKRAKPARRAPARSAAKKARRTIQLDSEGSHSDSSEA